MQIIEHRLGRPLEDVLRDLYVDQGMTVKQVAAQLGVDESTLRYRLARPPDAPDGRRDRARAVAGWEARIAAVQARFGDQGCPASVVYGVLVREFSFGGSYQAVRRYLRRQRGPAAVQAVRRIELPPGVQARYATIALRAAGGSAGASVRWTVDGASYRGSRWALQPGRHRFRAVSAAGDSAEVTVSVE